MCNSFKKLMGNFSQSGAVEWIGIRPSKKADIVSMDNVMMDTLSGIQGDHYAGRSGKRQVTLIQAEHLPAVANMMQMEQISPEMLRRNIVVKGLNLLALKDQRFQLGGALLEYTGLCHPCSRMEATLGKGGYNAMRGHGGITARVVQAGIVKLGDRCIPVEET